MSFNHLQYKRRWWAVILRLLLLGIPALLSFGVGWFSLRCERLVEYLHHRLPDTHVLVDVDAEARRKAEVENIWDAW